MSSVTTKPDQKSGRIREALKQELNERQEKGDRLTIHLTPKEALRLHHLLRLALRDNEINGLWKSTELAADIRERIEQWLSNTPALAKAVIEEKEWERKYEPSFTGRY